MWVSFVLEKADAFVSVQNVYSICLPMGIYQLFGQKCSSSLSTGKKCLPTILYVVREFTHAPAKPSTTTTFPWKFIDNKAGVILFVVSTFLYIYSFFLFL